MRLKRLSLTLLFIILGIFTISGWFVSPVLADGYYGYDTQGGSAYVFGPSYCWGNRYTGDFFAPAAAVTIDTFIVWCNGQNNNPKIVFGIYDIVGGVITNKIVVSDTLYVTGNTMQRWACSANLPLAIGATYTLCLDISGAGGPAVAYVDQASALSRNSSVTFPKTWADNMQFNYRCGIAAHYRDAAPRNSRRRCLIGGDK